MSQHLEITIDTPQISKSQRLFNSSKKRLTEIKNMKRKHGILPLVLPLISIIWLTILVLTAHIKEFIQDELSSFGSTAGVFISVFLYICLVVASMNDIKIIVNYIKTGIIKKQIRMNIFYYVLLLLCEIGATFSVFDHRVPFFIQSNDYVIDLWGWIFIPIILISLIYLMWKKTVKFMLKYLQPDYEYALENDSLFVKDNKYFIKNASILAVLTLVSTISFLIIGINEANSSNDFHASYDKEGYTIAFFTIIGIFIGELLTFTYLGIRLLSKYCLFTK